MSGSGIEWKLHSKGFDEELEEGQVRPPIFHAVRVLTMIIFIFQTLELRFKTLYSGSKPFVTKVGFNGEILCK